MAYLLEESCACALVIVLLGASLFIAATIFLVANQTLRAGLSAASSWAQAPSRRRMLHLAGIYKGLLTL